METIRQDPFETKSDIRQKPIIQDIKNKEDITQDITNKEDIIQDNTQDIISKTITSSDFAVIMGAIGVFLVTLVSAFAKDGDKTGV